LKTVFIICGPESSGNRLTASIFRKVGLPEVSHDYGDAMRTFKEPRDIKTMAENTWIFARRSIPHGGSFKHKDELNYLDIPAYEEEFVKRDFKPKWIIPIRSMYPLVRSKQKRKRTPKGIREKVKVVNSFVAGQYLRIFSGLIDIGDAEFHLFNTSLLMLAPDRELIGLENFIGFELPREEIKKEIYDADDKHYN